MKLLGAVLLAFPLALSLASCGGDQNGDGTTTKTVVVTTNPPPPPQFQPYENDTYTVEAPAGWTLEGDGNLDKGTYHESKWISPDDPETFVLIDVNDDPIDATPAESAATVKSGSSQGSDYRELNFASTAISGRDGFKWEFQNNGDQRVDYFFNDCDPQEGFAVLGSASPATFPDLAATFQHVVESVAVKCATLPPPPPNCDPHYPDPDTCLPPYAGDPSAIDCADIPVENFTALPPDPYHLDGSPPEEAGSPDFEPPDGVACETYP